MFIIELETVGTVHTHTHTHTRNIRREIKKHILTTPKLKRPNIIDVRGITLPT